MYHFILLLGWLIVLVAPDCPAQSTYTFTLHYPGTLPAGAVLGLRGSSAPLSWEKSIELKPSGSAGHYQASIMHPNTPWLAYKYVIEEEKKDVIWELGAGENRLALLDQTPRVDTWDVQPEFAAQGLPQLDPAALQAELGLLHDALVKLHAAPYRHTDSLSLEQRFAQLATYFQQPRQHAEVYRAYSELLGTLRCGHTFASFYNQNTLWQAILFGQKNQLPFAFTWLDGEMVVTRSTPLTPTLVPGTRVLAINGLPIQEVLAKLLPVVKADGDNDAKRIYDLQVTGLGFWEAFDAYFPLYVQPDSTGSFALAVQAPTTANPQLLRVAAVSRAQRNQALAQQDPALAGSWEDSWQFKILPNRIGYLRLGTFAIWNFKLNWRKFLQQAFEELQAQQIPQLIIDLRGNEGGADDVAGELARYLIKKPCTMPEWETRTRFLQVPTHLKPYLSTWDTAVFDLRRRGLKPQGAYFVEPKAKPLVLPPGKRPYTGQAYLLVDAGNSSSTFYLAQTAQKCQLAILAGSTTGGSQQGLNGGFMFFLRLPGSGIEIDVPIFGEFAPQRPAGGIEPDWPLAPTLTSIASGKDEVLEQLLQRLEGRR